MTRPVSFLRTARPLCLAAVMTASCAGLISCAGSWDAGRVVRDASGIEDPIATLETRARLQLGRPAPTPGGGVLARIVPDAAPALTPGSPPYQRAMTEPGDIELGAVVPGKGADDAEGVEPEQRAQGVKLYARARALRQAGRADEAIEVLRRAERVDPGSPAVQRELGDALMGKGDQAGAVSAYERGIELGDRSARALVHAASLAAARGDQDRIMVLTTRALDDPEIDASPMARSIAMTLLGNARIDAGYLLAGASTLEEALRSFDSGSRDGRWRHEIVRILSQRVSLWIKAGDAWGAIGDHERAQSAYAQADADGGDAPVGLVGRRLAGFLRQGRPCRAALLLLDHIQNRVGDLGPEERVWAHELARLPSVGDLLGDAIGQLSGREGLTPSIRRSLFALRVGASSTDRALALIGDAGLDADTPAALASVLGRIEDPDDCYEAAVGLLRSNPGIAQSLAGALARTAVSPVGLLRSHRKAAGEAAELLNTAIGIDLGRADLVAHLETLDTGALAERSTPWLAAHAQALALTGRWERARQLAGELERRAGDTLGADDDAVRRLASTRLVLQEPGAAWSLARTLGDDADATVRDLVVGAQIARLLGEREAAVSYLERASEHDPYDANILEQLMLLRAPGVGVGGEGADDGRELQEIVRRLGANRPRSSLFGLLRANDLARNSMAGQAEALLLTLNAQRPGMEIGYDLLLSIWKTRQTQGDEGALSRGARWLADRLSEHPNSNQTALTLAKLHFELEEYEKALGVLERAYARTGSFELARAAEQLLGAQLDRPGEAQEHLAARLGDQRGVDPTIEYAGALARRASEEGDRLLLGALANLPPDITLLPAQVGQLSQVVYTLADQSEERDNAETLGRTIGVIESRTGVLDFNLARIKLLLLAQQPRPDLDELLAVTMAHAAQMDTEERRRALEALPAQALIGEGRAHEAIVLVTLMATRGGALDEGYIVELYRMLGALGVSADVIGVLDTLSDKGLMARAIAVTTERLGTPRRASENLSPDQQRADLAYTAAAMASAFNREEQAMSFYQLALSYDPDHAWSNNDYGYMLAEKGERLDEAIRMLRRAVDAEPGEASIVDSLAWARYKTGVFEDVVDPQSGEVLTEGAVTLLTRANELDTRRDNATIVQHLGDALWRAGHEDRAVEAWLNAENMLRARIRLLSTGGEQNQRAIAALSQSLREIRYRIQDAESTGKPRVAPILGEPETP